MATAVQAGDIKKGISASRIRRSDEIPSTFWSKAHFIFFFLWFTLVTIPFSIWQIVAFQFSKKPSGFKFRGKLWSDTILWATGYKTTVIQKTELGDGPYVFVSNHQNGLDIPVHLSSIPIPCAFVAKSDLKKTPFLGWALSSSNNIFVDRSTARKAVESLNKAAEQIKNGQSVLIYPEGMRTWSAEMTDFLKGAFQLAIRAGVPIVPTALFNAYEFMDERRRVSRPGNIVFVIGEPLPINKETPLKGQQLADSVKASIDDLLQFAQEQNT